MVRKASSTLEAFLALVSKKGMPNDSAYSFAATLSTTLSSRSLLLPETPQKIFFITKREKRGKGLVKKWDHDNRIETGSFERRAGLRNALSRIAADGASFGCSCCCFPRFLYFFQNLAELNSASCDKARGGGSTHTPTRKNSEVQHGHTHETARCPDGLECSQMFSSERTSPGKGKTKQVSSLAEPTAVSTSWAKNKKKKKTLYILWYFSIYTPNKRRMCIHGVFVFPATVSYRYAIGIKPPNDNTLGHTPHARR